MCSYLRTSWEGCRRKENICPHSVPELDPVYSFVWLGGQPVGMQAAERCIVMLWEYQTIQVDLTPQWAAHHGRQVFSLLC